MIVDHSPGAAVTRDELSAWVAGFDPYRGGKGGDRQDWFSVLAGSGLKVDRKAAEPMYVAEPTISVVGGIQPDMLAELAHEAGHDGFIDRFIWGYPEAPPAEWADEELSEEAEAAAADLFRRLRLPETSTIPLTPEARTVWVEWFNENHGLTATAAPAVAGVYSKLPVQAARLALVLHALWHPGDTTAPVGRERMEDAITLAEYFRAHAHRVLPHFGASPEPRFAGLPARVLGALRREGERQAEYGGWVNRTGLHRALGNAVKAAELDVALDALLAAGRVERRTAPSATKAAEEWRVVESTPAERMNSDELSREADDGPGMVHAGSFVRGGVADNEDEEGEV